MKKYSLLKYSYETLSSWMMIMNYFEKSVVVTTSTEAKFLIELVPEKIISTETSSGSIA